MDDEAGVRLQVILYAPEEAARLGELLARDRLPWRDVSVLYVLGRYTVGQMSRPADLLPFLAPGTPRFVHCMVCAFGRREQACVIADAAELRAAWDAIPLRSA